MHEAVARMFAAMPDWLTQPEVTFAYYADRGSIDILAWHAASRTLLVIELKTEIVDVQDTVAVLDKKVRNAPKIAEDRGWKPLAVARWLIVADSATNRRRVGAHRAMLRTAYPVDGRTMPGWLAAPDGPIAALSFLAPSRSKTGTRGMAAVYRVRPRIKAPKPSGT
jgi:hypothetical protein